MTVRLYASKITVPQGHGRPQESILKTLLDPKWRTTAKLEEDFIGNHGMQIFSILYTHS